MRVRFLCAVVCAAPLALLSATVRAEPDAGQAAYCVAALKSRAEPYAERLRRGEDAVEAQLMPIVTASFAFIGTAYKQGVGSTEADSMMKQAEQAQAKLPPAELGRVQDRCQAQGQQLLAQASYFERQFVQHKAQQRIDKLRKPAS